MSKYEEVVQQLSLSKEFSKQFNVVATAASKEAKRDARKVSDSLSVIQAPVADRKCLVFVELVRASDSGSGEVARGSHNPRLVATTEG